MAEWRSAYEGASSKRDAKTALCHILRKGWKSSDVCPAGHDRAHYFDVELAAEAICHMPGPKPSLDYLDAIAELLRGSDNWRPLLHARNMKEVGWVEQILTGDRVAVDGHFKSKVDKQAQWLVAHKRHLGDGFIAAAADILDRIYDDDGHKVLDRRRLA